MDTNFAALQPKQKLVWSREVWEAARDAMFINRFLGDENSVIQRITELTETERGEQVIMQLVADLVEDGVQGDNEREGYEEAMQNYSQIINMDLISHGVKSRGKLATQKSVLNFRKLGRNRLAYWLANRSDQLAFLTMSGIAYTFKNDGGTRASSTFANLAFASDVVAPSTKRALMWDGSALSASNTASIASTYTVNYKMIVDAIAYAKDHYIRPLKNGGKDYYVFFMKPGALAQLKKDADYQRAVVGVATKSGTDSPWFQGGTVMVDGAVIHEHRLVYSTKGAASGSKWGAASAVDGTRTLLCGAQAMGMVDLGPPDWVEKKFQYDSQDGINVDKMFGFLKPQFYSIYDGSVEDFGLLTIDHYLQ